MTTPLPLPVEVEMTLEEIPNGVTAVPGFRATGLHCGIRKRLPDLALLVADAPCSAAGMFTQNTLAAAPVVLCRESLRSTGGRAQAVVVNSGNANACTGPQGMDVSRNTAAKAAELLGLRPEEVLVCSTGVIGVPLPFDPIASGLQNGLATLSTEGGRLAAEAILTTDTCTKEAAVEVTWSGGSFRIGGMAKGSGMIHPNMATTLAFLTTDAPVPAHALDAALRPAVDRTFNRISVDGDTSTNDAVLVLANGQAPGEPFLVGTQAHAAFAEALQVVLKKLALMVVTDGEGASRTMEVQVTGAANEQEAVRAARAVCVSPLVKTALHGADPNWGRIVSSIGATGVELQPEQMTVVIEGLQVLGAGFETSFDEEEAVRRLRQDRVTVQVDLGVGQANATAWTCDLTNGYISINADYRT